jgi:hypothetical protein
MFLERTEKASSHVAIEGKSLVQNLPSFVVTESVHSHGVQGSLVRRRGVCGGGSTKRGLSRNPLLGWRSARVWSEAPTRTFDTMSIRDLSKINLINNNYLNYVSEKGESTSPRLRSTDFHCLEIKQNRRTTRRSYHRRSETPEQQRSPVSKQGSVVVVIGQSVSQVSKRRKLN